MNRTIRMFLPPTIVWAGMISFILLTSFFVKSPVTFTSLTNAVVDAGWWYFIASLLCGGFICMLISRSCGEVDVYGRYLGIVPRNPVLELLGVGLTILAGVLIFFWFRTSYSFNASIELAAGIVTIFLLFVVWFCGGRQ